MLLSPSEFGQLAEAMGAFVALTALITIIAFWQKWGWRFRMVGVTLFSVVLTVGLFALSLEPITRTSVAGAVPYKVVYDRFSNQVVVAVPPTITANELEATLRQAGSNLFSSGRSAQGQTQLIVRARTVVHPRAGLSKPIYLGQIKRSLRLRNDPNQSVEIMMANLQEAAQVNAATQSAKAAG
jgi:hypothetical protein